MKQTVKMLLAMLLIAMCLTSDTASYMTQVQCLKLKVQVSAKRLSVNYAAGGTTGRKLPSWECQNLTFQPAMPLHGSTQK